MSHTRRHSPLIALFAVRPRLTGALALGAVAGVGAGFAIPALALSSCFILGWDVACLGFIGLMAPRLVGAAPEAIRAHAAQDDEGRGAILALMTLACAFSVAAVAKELGLARVDHGLTQTAHVVFAFVTVTLSWAMMQLLFAVHYAHEFYSPDANGKRDAGGLAFPGGEAPDYWDFLHFSVVIGVAAQTADVAFTSKALRRVGTMHSVAAFIFNTLIVALTINLVAGLV